MSGRFLAHIVILSVVSFGAVKLLGHLIWAVFGVGNQLAISLNMLFFAGLVAIALGVALGFLFRMFQVVTSDQNVKSVGAGTVGISLMTGLCASGTCLLPVLSSGVASMLLFLPIAVGIKLAQTLSELRKSGASPSPQR